MTSLVLALATLVCIPRFSYGVPWANALIGSVVISVVSLLTAAFLRRLYPQVRILELFVVVVVIFILALLTDATIRRIVPILLSDTGLAEEPTRARRPFTEPGAGNSRTTQHHRESRAFFPAYSAPACSVLNCPMYLVSGKSDLALARSAAVAS